MLYRMKIRDALIAGALAAVSVAPAFAADMTLTPVRQGNVTYITGGIGETETDAIKASAGNYDLQLSNAEKDGSYTTGVDIVIRTASGQEILQARNSGPLLYAELPPGNYVIHATLNGVHREVDAKVPGKGAANVNLIWPLDN